jgi:hypothetical protein
MARFESGTRIEMNVRETVALRDVRGATLHILRGTVWITQQNDSQDIVLRTGDTWTVERNGLTLVEAQACTRFRVIGRQISPPAPVRTPVFSRVRAALASLLTMPTRRPVPYV